jgi:SET domain-containing protein
MKYKLKKPEKISIGKSRLKGRGMFADEDIKKGEILEECHLIISGCPIKMQDSELKRYVFSLFLAEDLTVEKNEEVNFRVAFLSFIEDRELLEDLKKDVKELGYEDLSSIFTTATVLGNGMIYNHAELNNVDCRMNFKDFCFCYSANRDIKRGEELFINYGQSSRKDLK